ncbi:hypothetical protein LTS17_003585 [Exophiala oligosperma]
MSERTLDVPTQPTERAKKVANDFAIRHLGRPFTYTTDFIHLPSDFDTSERKNIWVLYDFNIRRRLDRVEEVPLQSWKVTYKAARQPGPLPRAISSNLKED